MVEKNTHVHNHETKKIESTVNYDKNLSVSFYEQNLHLFSLPLLATFSVINHILRFVVLISQYVWKHIVQLRGCIEPSQRQCVYEYDDEVLVDRVLEDMPNTVHETNQFLKQRVHHRKAFEYVSQALKIDEENLGRIVFLIIKLASQWKILFVFHSQAIRSELFNCTKKV